MPNVFLINIKFKQIVESRGGLDAFIVQKQYSVETIIIIIIISISSSIMP